MSVEFRQRTPGEYARIAWKRKWLIILPTIAIATAIAWVVYKLPSVYESTTLIVVKPPTISNTVVTPINDVDLTLRLNNISQLVTSRTSLEPLIQRYDLYKIERHRGAGMEEVVQQMRKDIRVEIAKSKDESTTGFQISYRGNDQRATQLVTMELAGKYISENTSATTNMTASTKQFFENELSQAKAELDEVDRKRLAYMQQNIEHLPSGAPALIGQLTGLHEQQKSYITETGRLRDRRTAVSSLLNDIAGQSDFEKLDVAERLGDPKTTPAYGQLAQRKAQLQAELQDMLTKFRPQNPEVKAKQAEVTAVQGEIDDLVNDGKNKVAEMRKKLENRSDPRLAGYKAELQIISGEIVRQERLLSQTGAQIAQLEQRLNRVPGAEVGLETLSREYLSKKAQYDSLLDKEQRATLAANVATNQQGEAIGVIDPASLPERPVAPNRPLLMALGLALGLMVGLLLAAIFEVPRLLTVQTTKDAEHYTGLTVLISVPELMTPREKSRLNLRHAVLVGVGVAATVVSIPTLAYLLKLSRLFELFVA